MSLSLFVTAPIPVAASRRRFPQFLKRHHLDFSFELRIMNYELRMMDG